MDSLIWVDSVVNEAFDSIDFGEMGCLAGVNKKSTTHRDE